MIIKILHLLAMALALGAGVSRLLLAPIAAREPTLAPGMAQLAKVTYHGIALLWLTGLWLWIARYGGSFQLGGGFHLKLTAVVLLTALALVTIWRQRAGRPFAPATGRRIGMVMIASAVVAVIGAVWSFGA